MSLAAVTIVDALLVATDCCGFVHVGVGGGGGGVGSG